MEKNLDWKYYYAKGVLESGVPTLLAAAGSTAHEDPLSGFFFFPVR